MPFSDTASAARLVVELNDLIQLDLDAVHAYTVAIAQVSDRLVGETLERFRADHERHVRTLSEFVRAVGGRPAMLPHLPTGLLKLIVQAVGAFGGTRGVLLALQANEAQAREKYARHAATHFAMASGSDDRPAEITAALERHAADERAHYSWVSDVLAAMGAGPGTMVGTAAQAFGAMHGANADAIEAAQRAGAAMLDRAWRIL
jgi:hypothetical protein